MLSPSQAQPRRRTAAWHDAQYNNRALVPECPQILQTWQRESARVRVAFGKRFVAARYGAESTEGVDVFLPSKGAAAPAPLLLFIHGGYWRSLAKEDFSFVVEAFCRAGAVVMVPDYALCPAVRIEHIALQMAHCLGWAYTNAARFGADAQRLVVAGHSAGGHLAAMLAALDGSKLGQSMGQALPQRLLHEAVALSGLFEMAPLKRTPYLQRDLRLSAASLPRLSPARFAPPDGLRLQAWVGALESEEFRRHNRLIQRAWGSQVVSVCEEVPGCHHFSVLEAWARAGTRAHGMTLQALGLTPPPGATRAA
jgi:arylformamidase